LMLADIRTYLRASACNRNTCTRCYNILCTWLACDLHAGGKSARS